MPERQKVGLHEAARFDPARLVVIRISGNFRMGVYFLSQATA
jgi:hypothetical protein